MLTVSGFRKTKNNRKKSAGICLYILDNLCDTICHYTCIAANEILLNKN